MARKLIDCREWPGPCTLAVSGEEDEVVDAYVFHVVQTHGLRDSRELRDQVRAALKDAPTTE
jgi:predicted small metal-binding protein